jgi:CHASE3 domain sensor protein
MKEKHIRLLRWIPVVGSLLVVALVAIISGLTFRELREAVYWRNRTFETILETQTYEDLLLDAQGRVRHYAAEGAPKLLIEYQNDTNTELREFEKLAELTRDNPEQLKQLQELNAAVNAVFDLDNRVIAVYARQGPAAALKTETEGADVVDTAIQDLEKLTDEEKNLLHRRDLREQADFHKAARLLIVASVVASLLLVLTNYFTAREMRRRRLAEKKQRELIDELQTALAEVKTLSGMIPICAWCKNVRSDQGFWQSVENYVTSHTDAKFSHGMCPNCSEKWKAEIAKSETSLHSL